MGKTNPDGGTMALKLDRIFSDGMILQREKPVAVWGTADPGQTVTVRAQGQSASVVTRPLRSDQLVSRQPLQQRTHSRAAFQAALLGQAVPFV